MKSLKIFKKPLWFTIITTLCLVIVALFVAIGCNKQEISQEIPPVNEETDPALLIGEWDCVKFAYTEDGKTISDVAAISKGHLEIPFAPTPVENNPEDRWCFEYKNAILFICSISGNLIELKLDGYTYAMPPPEELAIAWALENAYSFAVKDDELMIYFAKGDHWNLLILKKQNP